MGALLPMGLLEINDALFHLGMLLVFGSLLFHGLLVAMDTL